MSDDATVVLVDLDGTLLKGNSFHILMAWLAVRLLKPGRGTMGRNRRLWSLVVARVRHRVDRVTMKQRVQELVAECTTSDADEPEPPALLIRLLRAQVDEEILTTLDAAKDRGAHVVMATAALPEYAVPLAAALGHPETVCTSPAASLPWFENLGAGKRDRVLEYLRGRGLEDSHRILISDHPDDLPLAEVCDQAFWVARRATRKHRTELAFHGEPFDPEAVLMRVPTEPARAG